MVVANMLAFRSVVVRLCIARLNLTSPLFLRGSFVSIARGLLVCVCGCPVATMAPNSFRYTKGAALCWHMDKLPIYPGLFVFLR